MIVCPPPEPTPGTTTQSEPRTSRPGATAGNVPTTGTLPSQNPQTGVPNTTGQGPPAQGTGSTSAAPTGDANTLMTWAAQFVDRSDPRFEQFFGGSDGLSRARYSTILRNTLIAAYSIQWSGIVNLGGNPVGGFPLPANAGDIFLAEFDPGRGYAGEAWYFPSPDPGRDDSPTAFDAAALRSESPLGWTTRVKDPAIGGRVAVYPSDWALTPRPVTIQAVRSFITPSPSLLQPIIAQGLTEQQAYAQLFLQVGAQG